MFRITTVLIFTFGTPMAIALRNDLITAERPFRRVIKMNLPLTIVSILRFKDVKPFSNKAGSFRCSANPLEVIHISSIPGIWCNLFTSSTTSLLTVGSPPVNLILWTPSEANILASLMIDLRFEDKNGTILGGTIESICHTIAFYPSQDVADKLISILPMISPIQLSLLYFETFLKLFISESADRSGGPDDVHHLQRWHDSGRG